jgi:hypothetical protein
MSQGVWLPVPGFFLLTCAAGCMDYGLNAPRHIGQPNLEDTAIPVEPPPEDSAAPLVEVTVVPIEEEEEPITEPDAGCADGQREGYQDWAAYPDIAACSGAWTVGGLTRADLAPTCGHGAGDDSWNTEGSGCSAADLCSAGWHVCQGKTEVAQEAGSCDDAVPWGTPDKSLLFAVVQHSDNGSVCDDGAGNGNDVFGCGNLGTVLTGDKNCGVLNRVLASMHQDSCGFNEAEPNLGPWECVGGSESHYHEGELVTKKGCPGGSCSYDGYPVGNSDKGGVLCCRD